MLQGCSCLSGVKTYLPGLKCRGTATLCSEKERGREREKERERERRLFKQCRNVSAVHCAAGVQLFQ